MDTQTFLLLLGFILLALGTVVASVNILTRGSVYRRIKPQSRPRRWVLYLLLIMFGAFALWFPVWFLWPQSSAAKVLTLVFASTLGIGGLTLKWLRPFVDAIYERNGWELR